MATYDLTKAPNALYPIAQGATEQIFRHTLNVATDMTTQNNGDIAKVIALPAGSFVANVLVRNVVASTTGSSTFTVGDTASGTGYVVSVAATGAANTITAANGAYLFTQSGSTPFAVTWVGGKMYTSADSIQVVLGATPPANGIFEIIADIIQIPTGNATF